MQKISAIYKDSGIVVQTKAPSVAVVLTVVAFLFPLIILLLLLDGRIVNALLMSVIEVIMIISIVQLYRGRFRSATVLPLVLITIMLIALSFVITARSVFQVYTIALYMVPPLVLSLAISETEWHTVAVVLVGVINIIAASLLVIRPALPTGESMVFSLTVATFVYVISGLIAFLVARSNRRSMELIEQTNAKNQESLQSIAKIVKDADSSVDALRSVENQFKTVKSGSDAIRQQTKAVNDRIEELRKTVDQALSFIRKSTDRVSGFHELVDEQNTVVQESTAAVNEMSASLDSVAAITHEKQESSERLLSIGEAGLEGLKRTNASFEIVTQEVDALHEINKIVSDIAAQTNLLSMNAAIEAAHAGSAGGGFAIVADEIRKLATNTGENSRVVSERLKNLMDTVSKTSSHVAQSTSSMEEIAREVRLVSEAFGEITGSTAELSSGGREILQAMQVLQNTSVDVRDGSDEITQEQGHATSQIESINSITEQIGTASLRMEQSIEEIDKSMEDLQETIVTGTKRTSVLTESISRFSTQQYSK